MTKTITYALVEVNDDGTETTTQSVATVIESREQLEALFAAQEAMQIAARRSKRTATCGHCRSQYDPTMGSCGCYDGDCQ